MNCHAIWCTHCCSRLWFSTIARMKTNMNLKLNLSMRISVYAFQAVHERWGVSHQAAARPNMCCGCTTFWSIYIIIRDISMVYPVSLATSQ